MKSKKSDWDGLEPEDRGICSNENMEVSGQRKIARPKLRCHDDLHKGEKEYRKKIREH